MKVNMENKEQQKNLITEIMQEDQKDGLYEKLTAMQQLIHWLDSDCTPMDCLMKAKELLKVEKEQIMDANATGYTDGILYANGEDWHYQNSEHYYDETYGKQ